MDADEFYDLVQRMRDAQKAFHRTRSEQCLAEAKKLERLVDRALASRHADMTFALAMEGG